MEVQGHRQHPQGLQDGPGPGHRIKDSQRHPQLLLQAHLPLQGNRQNPGKSRRDPAHIHLIPTKNCNPTKTDQNTQTKILHPSKC